jgi:hypothetical protein
VEDAEPSAWAQLDHGGNELPPETLPLLLATLIAYVALGSGTLFRVRRRRRSEMATRTGERRALRVG